MSQRVTHSLKKSINEWINSINKTMNKWINEVNEWSESNRIESINQIKSNNVIDISDPTTAMLLSYAFSSSTDTEEPVVTTCSTLTDGQTDRQTDRQTASTAIPGEQKSLWQTTDWPLLFLRQSVFCWFLQLECLPCSTFLLHGHTPISYVGLTPSQYCIQLISQLRSRTSYLSADRH